MDGAATTRRRRLQISLRAILIVVTACAVGYGVYWVLLPRIKAYRERLAFEESLRTLEAGVVPNNALRQIRWMHKTVTTTQRFDRRGNPVLVSQYVLPDAIFCVYYWAPKAQSGSDPFRVPCAVVKVFRLDPAPANYVAKTPGGKRVIEKTTPAIKPGDRPLSGYIADFIEVIVDGHPNDFGLKFEEIHSDGVMPAAK